MQLMTINWSYMIAYMGLVVAHSRPHYEEGRSATRSTGRVAVGPEGRLRPLRYALRRLDDAPGTCLTFL